MTLESKYKSKLYKYRFLLKKKLKEEQKDLKWFEENGNEFYRIYLEMVEDTEKELEELEALLTEDGSVLL